MHRFYLPSPDIKAKLITINDKRIIHQAERVLRMKQGSHLQIFDDKGREYVIEILEINRRKILGNVIESIKNKTESKLEVSLYQAIPKKPALFELIVQKATEIGVRHIYPLITERTEKRRLAKFERLHMIAIEATEQSGRLQVPTIHHPVALENILPGLTKCFHTGFLG